MVLLAFARSVRFAFVPKPAVSVLFMEVMSVRLALVPNHAVNVLFIEVISVRFDFVPINPKSVLLFPVIKFVNVVLSDVPAVASTQKSVSVPPFIIPHDMPVVLLNTLVLVLNSMRPLMFSERLLVAFAAATVRRAVGVVVPMPTLPSMKTDPFVLNAGFDVFIWSPALGLVVPMPTLPVPFSIVIALSSTRPSNILKLAVLSPTPDPISHVVPPVINLAPAITVFVDST